jgi:class 3 adenylate cyclase
VEDGYGAAAKVDVKSHDYETALLTSALKRIGNLLSVGFGEAGQEIISKVLRGGQRPSEFPGNKVFGIFGFGLIYDFDPLIDILGEDVMLFANEVAAAVHLYIKSGVCFPSLSLLLFWSGYMRGGPPPYLAHPTFYAPPPFPPPPLQLGSMNKNLGEAFLMVWRFNDDGRLQLSDKSTYSPEDGAEAALRGLVQMVTALPNMAMAKDWENHEKIKRHLPDFRVRLGFGLHYGWAIEGAIGSMHKIDASYLSPHVNLSARLESATKQYVGPTLRVPPHCLPHRPPHRPPRC